MHTPEGDATARQLAAALVSLTELEKVSAADAEAIWVAIVNHVRSQRPQALLALTEVP